LKRETSTSSSVSTLTASYAMPADAEVGAWSVVILEQTGGGSWDVKSTATFFVSCWFARATADSYVDQSHTGTNYGSSDTLSVKGGTTTAKRTYIKFDLSDLPSGAVITSAKLHLWRTGGNNVPSAYETTDGWVESTITWSNKPAYGDLVADGASDVGSWYVWDVKDYASSEFAGDKTMSILLKFTDESSASSSMDFGSKEQTTINTRPWLEICYTIQYQITVTADPSGALGGTFDVTYTKDGTTYTNEQHTTSWTETVDVGTDVTVSNPQYAIPPNYIFDHYDPSNTVTMSSAKTITLVYIELPIEGAVTAGGCLFDKNSADGQQFNLIFTRDIVDSTKYQLTASNPGQFFYNVFYVGTPGETVTITLNILEPFVTQGAVPIHVYSRVDVSSSGCFTPIDEILHVAEDPGTGGTITFGVTVPDTGLVYVRVHLDFGWKQQTGYNMASNNFADNTDDSFNLPNFSDFTFSYSVDGTTHEVAIENFNIFKNDPGFFGVVTINGDSVVGAKITIKDSSGKIIGTATTDENGYYSFYYKYSGKAAVFTVTVTSPLTGTSSQTVTLKSNKYIKVSFEFVTEI
jgi:hypothetical protein